MNTKTKAIIKHLTTSVIAVMAFVFIGPMIIHLGYSLSTNKDEKDEKKELYHELANSESKQPFEERKDSIEKRRSLYLWFHARGWKIDEGHEEHAIYHEWDLLIQHWQNERWANQATPTTGATEQRDTLTKRSTHNNARLLSHR